MIHTFSRVAESTTTTGTGDITLAGAITGARTFATAGAITGFLFEYAIEAVDSSGIPSGDWEVGIGEISAANTLSRRFVLASSNAGSAVNFAAGTKYVYLAPLGEGARAGLDTRRLPFYETDFLGAAGAATVEAASSVWDYAVISSGTQSKINSEANHPGILRTTSSTTANSGGYCLAAGSSVNSFRLAGGEFSQHIFRPITLTNSTVRMGFLDNTTSADATDGVYFELPATGAIVGKTANNATRSSTATLATLSINTWYRAVCALNYNATSAWFGVYSEAGSLLGSATLTTNIPTAAGRETAHGYVATNAGTTAVGIVEMDYMSVGIARPLTR